jgi:hypothetical protein
MHNAATLLALLGCERAAAQHLFAVSSLAPVFSRKTLLFFISQTSSSSTFSTDAGN